MAGQPTSVRLGDDTRARIKALADRTERSEARLIRYALELGLAELERLNPPVRKEEKV